MEHNKNTDTFQVNSLQGHLTVDLATGTVIRIKPREDDDTADVTQLEPIKSFNLPEWIKYHNGREITPDMDIDILDLGYWSDNNTSYTEPDHEWRKLIISLNENKVLCTSIPNKTAYVPTVKKMHYFPNGFVSWRETNFEVVRYILETEDLLGTEAYITKKDEGGSALYELAARWTDEFERLHEGIFWDGQWLDQVWEFLKAKDNGTT